MRVGKQKNLRTSHGGQILRNEPAEDVEIGKHEIRMTPAMAKRLEERPNVVGALRRLPELVGVCWLGGGKGRAEQLVLIQNHRPVIIAWHVEKQDGFHRKLSGWGEAWARAAITIRRKFPRGDGHESRNRAGRAG